MNEKKFQALIALDGPARYEYFVKRVVDSGKLWGLWNQGWALLGEDDGVREVFPVWPEREFAEICASSAWAEYEPREIALEDFVDSIAPGLVEKKMLIGVFFLPRGVGVTPEVERLLADFEREESKY